MKNPRFWTVAAISLALVVWASAAFAKITELRAQYEAARLAAALGWSYGPPSGIELMEPSGSHGPAYRVDFSDSAMMSVDADTGEVTRGMDRTQIHLLNVPKPPEGKLGERDARQAAERVLDVLGRPADIRFEKAYQRPQEKYWVFSWLRTFQGIPYLGNGIGIRISPVDGKLVSFGRHFPIAPPPTAEVKVGEQEAIAAARDAVAARGMTESAAASASARLMVVAKGGLVVPGAPSRVAWVVTLGEGIGFKELWIDAGDGSLLSLTEARGAGGPKTPATPTGPAGPSGATGGIMSSARARIILGSGLGLLALIGAFFVLRTRRAR